MMKTTDRSKFLHHVLGLACMTALTTSCIGDVGEPPKPDPPRDAAIMDVDPIGNWSLIYMLGAGCDQPASTETMTFTVTRTTDGYEVSAPGVTATGTMICTQKNCKLSAILAGSTADGEFQQNVNLVLDAGGTVTGGGTISVVTETTTCGITFTVTGVKG